MGIKERQDRERQAVRDAILDAARDLFVTEGYRHVSIRKIAERIEYSPAAIYSYFPGKDDIFFALAEEGFRLLDEKVRSVDTADLPPIDRLRRFYWLFYEFSKEQKQYFDLMFIDRSVPSISDRWGQFEVMQQLMMHVEKVTQDAIDAGVLPAELNACVAMHVMWGALMGPAALGLAGRMPPEEDVDALARDVLEATLAGLRAGTRPTFIPCDPKPYYDKSEQSTGARSHES